MDGWMGWDGWVGGYLRLSVCKEHMFRKMRRTMTLLAGTCMTGGGGKLGDSLQHCTVTSSTTHHHQSHHKSQLHHSTTTLNQSHHTPPPESPAEPPPHTPQQSHHKSCPPQPAANLHPAIGDKKNIIVSMLIADRTAAMLVHHHNQCPIHLHCCLERT